MKRVTVACVAVLVLSNAGCVHVALAAAPIKLNGPLVAGGDVSTSGLQFSSDGSRVLYRADQAVDEVFEVYSVASTGGAPVKLNGALVALGDVSISGLEFSPDGSRVLYHADQAVDEVFEIYSVPSTGGAAVKLNSALVAGGDVSSSVFDLRRFSANGSRVLYHADQTVNDVFEIYSVPSTGGAPVKLNATLVSGGDVFSNDLQFSPNGDRVLYLADQNTDNVLELYSVPSLGGTPVKLNGTLVAGGNVSAEFQFSPDSNRVVYMADQETNGIQELYSVISSGGTPVKLNGPLVSNGHVSTAGLRISPDSSHVLYLADQETENVNEVYIVPIAGGTPIKLNGTLVSGGETVSSGLQFSSDGSRVLYCGDEIVEGVTELFSVPSAGGTSVKLNGPLVAGGHLSTNSPRFSPDGSRVVYLADQDTDNIDEIYSVPSAGGTPVKLNGALVSGGDVSPFGLQFSPDSSHVLYLASQDTFNVNELYLVPSGGGTAVKVNAPGRVDTTGMQFSPDGSLVLFIGDQNLNFVFEVYARIVRLHAEGAAGSWDTASTWDYGVAPDEIMQVFIDASTSITASGNPIQRTANALHVGNGGGTAMLTLESDALITTINGVFIDGGGVVRGDGRFVGDVSIGDDGEIRAGAGDQLRISGDLVNEGSIQALGVPAATAEIEIDGAATNSAGSGLIAGQSAVLRFTGGLTNQGSVAMTFGVNNVFGDIDNTGSVVVSGGAHATFYDDIDQNGTLRVSQVGATTSVAVILGDFSGTGGSTGGGDIFFEGDLRPGNSPATVTFGNDISFGSGTTLEIELGGAEPGTEYDQVHVSGDLTLSGTLDVSLVNGFMPTAGAAFEVLDWTTLSGTFDTLLLPALVGALEWDTSHLYTLGLLSVVLPGDFNLDGTVDAADYVMWRKADSGNPQGYTDWQANFGEGMGGGSAGASHPQTSVPEPATLVLLIFAAAGWSLRRSRFA